jgi:hypothetical protein
MVAEEMLWANAGTVAIQTKIAAAAAAEMNSLPVAFDPILTPSVRKELGT